MGPPVRTVCIACLQSLEIDEDLEGQDGRPTSCPYCGKEVQSTPVRLGHADDQRGTTSARRRSSTPRRLTPEGDAARRRRTSPAGSAGSSSASRSARGATARSIRAYDPHLRARRGPEGAQAQPAGREGPGAVPPRGQGRRQARPPQHRRPPRRRPRRRTGAGSPTSSCHGQTLSMFRDMHPPSIRRSRSRIVRELALALEHAHGRAGRRSPPRPEAGERPDRRIRPGLA